MESKQVEKWRLLAMRIATIESTLIDQVNLLKPCFVTYLTGFIAQILAINNLLVKRFAWLG